MINNNLRHEHVRAASLVISRICLAAVILFFIPPLLNISVVDGIIVEPGDAAPDFTLTSLEDKEITLSTLKGSIVVLVYLTTEQTRSLEAMKDVQSIFEQYREKGVQVLGVTADAKEKESILKTARKYKIDFPILVDSQRNVYGAYGIRVYPSTVIINREGSVAYGVPGHSLSYRVKMHGRIRFLLEEINEEELKAIMTPVREVKDEALLKAERRYNLALTFTRSRLNDQAIMMARQSISAKPDLAKSHVLLGFLLLEEQEAEEAYDEFTRALELAPESKDAMTGLGSALIEKGELDRAVELLTKAASLNPRAQRALYELGKAYSLKGDVEKSVEMFKTALEKIIHKQILPSSLSKCE